MSDRTGSEVTAKVRASRKRMGRAFFDHSPEVVARQLLGKVLRHKYEGEWLSGRIVEVEAYLGLDDPASHTFIGQTERNRVLFGPSGVVYVYLVYGMYYCLNVSCLPAGQPGGVLFRAIEQGSTIELVDDGYHVSRVVVTPRIGIKKGADLPLRFLITGDHRAADVKTEKQRARAT